MLLLVIIVVSALSISFLCSILEAALLSISLVRLDRKAEEGDKGAAILLDLKRNRIDDAISAILTYNTVAHTVGAALSGAQAAVVFGDIGVGIFSGVLTLLILVFTEIIPKTIGAVHAVKLAGFAGRTINLMTKPPMKWIIFVTRALTNLIAREKSKRITRGDVMGMLKVAESDGALHSAESRVLANWLKFEDIFVEDVMTPRTMAVMFEESKTLNEILDDPNARHFSRIPVYRKVRDDIIGYVFMRDLLRAALNRPAEPPRVAAFVRPVLTITEEMSVGKALNRFTEDSAHLAVVYDDLGVFSGVVTMEDMIETALGVEIVDETDKVADLRKAAIELRKKRMEQIRARRNKEGGRESDSTARESP